VEERALAWHRAAALLRLTEKYVIHRRDDWLARAHVLLGEEGQIDDVSDTDGLCVTSCPTSAQFVQRVLIVQDGSNAGWNQNFKLYGWADGAGTNLLIETGCQPRGATAGPRLTIQHAGNNVLVLLPRPITGYRLQEKNDLAAGNWSDVGPFSNQVTETLSAPARFYRLFRP